MTTPKILNESTLAGEVRSMIEDAKLLPADGLAYERGDIRMCHVASSMVRCEHVLVQRYGKLWRCIHNGKKWTRIDEPCGSI